MPEDTTLALTEIEIEQQKNENKRIKLEENTENTFSETLKIIQNKGNAEDNTNENVENTVVLVKNETQKKISQHIDKTII
jgi:hypothetical protein